MLMQSLENALREAGDARHVVCLLTQVEVDPAELIIHVAGSARPFLAHLHPTKANRPCHRNLLPAPSPRSRPAGR